MIFKKLKKYFLLFIMIIIIGPVFAQEKELKIEKIINFFAFGTGSTTGTYFPLGNAFAHVWTQKSKSINVMTYSSNGSYENIELLRNHEVNLAIAQSDIVAAALDGKGKFNGRPFKDLKVLMALYPEVIQIVVPQNSDIKTLS
ncbi:MAG: TAXI family TRAP transporter solute-binding subunit, partial [Candidatus Riflebacteria bacterium]|nr:TAXI family TRAP transporter solute-binding subunit [Candidatus Riflebacteria bacterium]